MSFFVVKRELKIENKKPVASDDIVLSEEKNASAAKIEVSRQIANQGVVEEEKVEFDDDTVLKSGYTSDDGKKINKIVIIDSVYIPGSLPD